ncbi:methylated-DNA-[protein]-cysteine S-methyltransferase [Desulfosarcina sp. BuS5]|uniref:methylated-DNA--[protein]-cysteine S-methyltransferase n=1 Tax=Desulfosarcina sp. BuS5 TaxID=933262 RepID=UPI00068518EE|nr:MGMT family protein [Desulfosarcina sp. BuS5]WDN87225.1 methylated-DNA-[protein]-cysteine S-methyltransferase [Desulfosarcina sp. BuS5]
MMFSLCVTTGFDDFAISCTISYNINPFQIVKIHLPTVKKEFPVKRIYQNGCKEFVVPEKGTMHRAPALIQNMIIDYCKGIPISTPWQWLDLEYLTELQRTVLTATAGIQYGSLRSYKEIAAAIGRPGAYRFVGSTLAKNRFPILIPCHRVIRSDGSAGMFGAGAALKKRLINHEGASCPL